MTRVNTTLLLNNITIQRNEIQKKKEIQKRDHNYVKNVGYQDLRFNACIGYIKDQYFTFLSLLLNRVLIL